MMPEKSAKYVYMKKTSKSKKKLTENPMKRPVKNENKNQLSVPAPEISNARPILVRI